MMNHQLRRIALVTTLVLAALGIGSMTPFPNSAGPRAGQVRPELDQLELKRDKEFDMEGVLDQLDIQPGMTVAEIGAGWGYLTFKLARRVAPGGLVLAEDIEPKRLDELKARATERGLKNIEIILGTETDPRLPEGQLDMIFIHAVLQWIVDRVAFFQTARAALKADGRLVIIEPETEGDDPEFGITGPGRFPTRAGYLELFRRAGFEPVSAKKQPDWKFPVFVLKKKLT